jgi:hypothetical protein
MTTVTAKTQAELDRISTKLEKVVPVDNRGVPQRFLGLEYENTQADTRFFRSPSPAFTLTSRN